MKYLLQAHILLLSVLTLGCGGAKTTSAEDLLRQENCKPAQVSKNFEESPYKGSTDIIFSFQNIRSTLNSACASCHMSPARNGGFTYIDSWKGKQTTIAGVSGWSNGFYEVAEKMYAAMTTEDPQKQMPPTEMRLQNSKTFDEMAKQLKIWIEAGKPEGSFQVGKTTNIQVGKPRPIKPHTTSEIGDCIPSPKIIGSDRQTDEKFENLNTLPEFLHETDLFSLDPFTLAQNGTLAYNVEYPLWADNADKGRWVHVPTKYSLGQLVQQSIYYDNVIQQFKIPENTRFYKTFYRAVTLPNKKIKMRRMETRIIVTRTPWEKSLFGTYQWDETEQVAMLVKAPYRDGTAWKDLLFDVITDENKGTSRPYGIPGRQRCIDCHRGGPMNNFVLGFQPLQINKRPWGAAGRIDPPASHDLDQVDRFISYGLLRGIKSVDELPVLEKAGKLPPQNIHEIRANGYMVGNCYHCHNPQGLAFTKENGIQLSLGPGDTFQFNSQQRSVQIPTRKIIHQNGELDSSHLWRKITDSPTQLGMFSQMPMHTPGTPDCRVMTVIGKWIRTFESPEAADLWQPECKKENPFFMIDMDFTWVQSDKYTPRRNDWSNPTDGMPEKYRQIQLSPNLEKQIKTEIPVGYWVKKPACQFPRVDLPKAEQRPWMLKAGQPKRPFGEVYATTPGAYFFRNTCMKCHGPRADGDTSLARGILNWSGGSVRVANLYEGMFGQKGQNLKTFDLNGTNYSGQYLIWMAMEGTRVKFPAEIASYMGKHGGQMLNGIREKCLAQISTDKPSSSFFMDHEIFNKVCFMNNLQPGHPDLAFNPSTNKAFHPERVEEWLDRGAWNAGWAIYEFLKEAAMTGVWRPSNDQCELVYKK